jgi:phosphoesterase RecJ-like protein
MKASRRTGSPTAVAERLRSARRVLITTHASPDGDAVGSELAMAELVEALRREAVIANKDRHPAPLRFLPGIDRIRVGAQPPHEPIGSFDLGVVLDCPDLDRTGIDGLAALPLVNIDHHLGNALFGDINLVDEGSPAVGELVLEVVAAAGVGLSPAMATNLHVALVTDTGDFRYANATPRAFRAAARLIEAGADPQRIAQQLWEHVPARVVRLTAVVLATLEIEVNGTVAVIHCDRAMLELAGARPEDTEDLVNHARAVEGVEVAVFLKAFAEDAVRVSLRSRGRVDVEQVAAGFGGGGHREASGCTLAMPLVQAREAVIAALAGALEEA